MKCMQVKFDEADQIINFVRIMNRFRYDADVKCGSHLVDAKSIVGVLSLSMSHSNLLELIVYTEDCADLLKHLESFAS